jgi:hypothetical protein
MSKTRTVYHPSITGVTRDVEETDSWKAAGWRLTDPAKTTTTAKAESAKSE